MPELTDDTLSFIHARSTDPARVAAWQIRQDYADLLAEVDRLRARVAELETVDATGVARVSSAAAFLSSRCDACQHTLNWHTNAVGCTVLLCVCGRFQPPADA